MPSSFHRTEALDLCRRLRHSFRNPINPDYQCTRVVHTGCPEYKSRWLLRIRSVSNTKYTQQKRQGIEYK